LSTTTQLRFIEVQLKQKIQGFKSLDLHFSRIKIYWHKTQKLFSGGFTHNAIIHPLHPPINITAMFTYFDTRLPL